MKIKTKLTLGVGLLFLLIILLSIVSARFITDLKNDTNNILVANYHTLEYSRNMLVSLEEGTALSLQKFEKNLQQQEKNFTEKGERETTIKLRKDFNALKENHFDVNTSGEIRKGIFDLMDLNMKAIQLKSMVAKATADKAVLWIVITGTMCFLIAFVLLINLPSNIANPIRELTESIKQIAARNYAERVHFEGHKEFGQLAHSFNTMAVKLEEYNSSNLSTLMKEKKRIETLINNMHDPVIGLDENLKIIFANEEAVKIIGMSKSDIIGQHSDELAAKNDLLKMLVQDLLLDEKIKNIKPLPIKIYADEKEGYFEKETIHISVFPTGEEIKTIIGHVIILRNITEYKELDSAKTSFISTISHEFKTPISSIKMSLELLGNEAIGLLNEEQRNLVISIDDDASRLLKITGELLNMTQVESGKIQLTMLPADPKEILLQAINTAQTQAFQKQITFDIDCPQEIPLVLADTEKTVWVLTNLITNAIRYSYDDSTIFCSIVSYKKMVEISVRDTGQGISPQYQSKVFERYFRVPGTNKQGTGLGLAISKDFMEAQNGQITLESEFGAGSTLSIKLNALE